MLACLKHEPFTLAEVAKKLGIKPPSAVPYLRGLEKQGFIQKRADPKDQRKIQLKITAKGERLFQDIVQGHPADVINQAFKKLSKEKQSRLSSLLQELTDNLTR
jgi:DNA-binding MarR family transcriptional regulator